MNHDIEVSVAKNGEEGIEKGDRDRNPIAS